MGSVVTKTTGASVIFNCSADGIPIPQVSWQKDGLHLNVNQQRYSVTTSTSTGFRSAQLPGVQQLDTTLTITNLKQHDQGSFSCIAQSANTDPAVLQTAYQLVVNKRMLYITIAFLLLSILHCHTATPPDHCKGSPCQNGGTCDTLIDGFYCHCTSSFTGKTCNTRKYANFIAISQE